MDPKKYSVYALATAVAFIGVGKSYRIVPEEAKFKLTGQEAQFLLGTSTASGTSTSTSLNSSYFPNTVVGPGHSTKPTPAALIVRRPRSD